MPTTIKVLREVLVNKLASIKDDNVSIADIVIERRKLLEALKLQTQEGAEIININYGLVSWYGTEDDNSQYSKHASSEIITVNEPCVQFSCNHTTMRFLNKPKPTHKGGSFSNPAIPLNFVDHTESTKPKLTGVCLDTQELIEALNFVIHGIASDDTRLVLACVCFDSESGTLSLVTADGFRLSIAKVAVKSIRENKVMIYRDDIPKLLAFLKSNIEGKGKHKFWLDTYMHTTKKTIQFMSDKGGVEFDKVQGEFPDYSQLIPKDGTRIEFIASQMIEGVKALSHIAKDGSGIIRLVFSKGESVGKITLTARSEELGDSRVECDALVEADCKIGVNSKYLIDLLRECGDSRITLRVTTPSSPMVFDVSEFKQETLMPMLVQW